MNKIPEAPRYEYVMEKVYKFIIDNNIYTYPLDIIEVIKQNKWSITKYSEIANEFNCTNDEICKNFQSNDGKTHLFIENKNYTYSIIYNDDLAINTDERIRFTLAHEIGHIYLNHLKDFKETEIQRNGLNNKSYSILEKEADMFARNLLCPYPLVKRIIKNCKDNEKNIQIINEVFKISKTASKIRLNLMSYDKKYPFNYDISKIKIIGNKYCRVCCNFEISHSDICNKCGNYWSYTPLDYIQFMKETNNIMKYNYYNYKVCDNCQNEYIIKNSNFCHVCGTDLRNLCTNENCKNNNISLPYNARFCNLCGAKSTFFKDGKLNTWSDEIKQSEIEQEFSNVYYDESLPF